MEISGEQSLYTQTERDAVDRVSSLHSHHCAVSMAPNPKRRKVETKTVEEITFDHSARQEYLSGFHKRKLERAKYARELAEKKARAEKLADRKRVSTVESDYSDVS